VVGPLERLVDFSQKICRERLFSKVIACSYTGNRQSQRDFDRTGARLTAPVMHCKQSFIKRICTKSFRYLQNEFACKATIVGWFANITQKNLSRVIFNVVILYSPQQTRKKKYLLAGNAKINFIHN